MPLWLGIIVGVLVIGVVFRIVFPSESAKIGVLFSGFTNKIIYDKAKTPEGAEALYTKAIEMAEDKYRDADDTLRQLSGRVALYKKELEQLKKDLDNIEAKCNKLAAHGDFESIEVLAEERDGILEAIEQKKQNLQDTIPLLNDTKLIHEEAQKRLSTLKIKKKTVIEGMKNSREFQKMADGVDRLKQTSATDKLLSSIDDGYRESQERLAGARESYNNRLETKVSMAEKRARAVSTNSYVEELKKKYQK